MIGGRVLVRGISESQWSAVWEAIYGQSGPTLLGPLNYPRTYLARALQVPPAPGRTPSEGTDYSAEVPGRPELGLLHLKPGCNARAVMVSPVEVDRWR
jgi:hypothetical protein